MAITPQKEQITIICQGSVLKQVETFKYLGAITAENGECSTESQARLRTSRGAVRSLDSLWKDRSLDIKVKQRLLSALLWTVTLKRLIECFTAHRCSEATHFFSDRQHLSYDGCLEVRGEIIRTVLLCIVYWKLCTVTSILRWAVLTVLWIGFGLTGPILLCVDSCFCIFCVVLSYCMCCIIVTWWGGPGKIEAWSLGHIFLQCFDTVGWVIWSVKTRPRYDL